jgi:HlyD family secretion protein
VSKRIIWGISALVLTSAVALGAWWTLGKEPEGVKVQLATVSPSAIHQEVYTTGTINPTDKQEIRVFSPSKVTKVSVKVGDTVNEGQTLVQLDTTLSDAQVAQAQASVNTAQSGLSTAQANLDALKSAQKMAVASTNSISMIQVTPKENTLNIPMEGQGGSLGSAAAPGGSAQGAAQIKQAEASVTQAQAMLKQAQEGLKVAKAQRDQNIYTARLKGTVLEINAQEGNLAPNQVPLVVVADLSKLRVQAQLNEVDAGKVQVGQKVDVSSKVLGEAKVLGTVIEIAPQAVSKVSVQGNTPPSVAVVVSLDNVPGALKPGFTVNLKILTASKEGVLAIPQEALFQESGKNYVFRVVNQKLEKTEISLGIVNETLQEVTTGLKAGEKVVLNPTSQLTQGMLIQDDMGSGTT